MSTALVVLSATTSCVKTSTAGQVTGIVILLALIAAIVGLAVANGRARSRLASANNELGYLRPENARLQHMVAQMTGTATADPSPTAYASDVPIPAQWYPDPSDRHQLRYWDGSTWTGHVSDNGVTSMDSP